MDLVSLIEKTKTQLKPFWGLSIIVCLVYGLLISIPSELNNFGQLLSLLIAGPLQLGLCIYFLKISNNNVPSFYDLFEGFKPLLNILLAFVIINTLTFIGLFLLLVPGIIVSLGFSMTYYIIAENPDLPFNKSLERSWEMMDGHKMELFILHIRFIPFYLLGVLFFLIGVFVVIPWHNLTVTNYYKALKKKTTI